MMPRYSCPQRIETQLLQMFPLLCPDNVLTYIPSPAGQGQLLSPGLWGPQKGAEG